MRVAALAVLVIALAAVPAQAADPVLVAAGDSACAPGDADYNGGAGTVPPAATPGRCHQNYTANLIEALNPTHMLALGDLQYEDGALAKFNVSYDASWGRAAIAGKTKPVPGNHEYGAGNTNGGNIHNDPNATGYFTYFQSQLAAEGPDAGDPQKGWYSFDVPVGGTKWHVVALNSECAAGLRVTVGWDGDCDAGSEQEQWLRADLAADASDCTIAYWHHPRFSSGNLGDNVIMAPIWDALYDDHADIVLTGHDHNYERFAPKGKSGAVEPGRGIRGFVVGTGGKDLLALKPPKPGSEVLANTAHGVLKLTLHGPGGGHPFGWYEWQFVERRHVRERVLRRRLRGLRGASGAAAPPGAAKPRPSTRSRRASPGRDSAAGASASVAPPRSARPPSAAAP